MALVGFPYIKIKRMHYFTIQRCLLRRLEWLIFLLQGVYLLFSFPVICIVLRAHQHVCISLAFAVPCSSSTNHQW